MSKSFFQGYQEKKSKMGEAAANFDCEYPPDRLDLKEGEVIEEIVADTKGWTRVRKEDGREGPLKTSILCKCKL